MQTSLASANLLAAVILEAEQGTWGKGSCGNPNQLEEFFTAFSTNQDASHSKSI